MKSNWRLKGEGNEIQSESERQFKSKSERESNKQEKEEDIMLMFTNCLPMFTNVYRLLRQNLKTKSAEFWSLLVAVRLVYFN